MGSKVPFWQFFNFFKMTLLNAWKHYFEAGVFYIKDSLFLDVISSEKNGRTLCYDITLCHALKTDLPCETRCLYKLLSIKYHWLNVPIFCRQYSTLSHGSGKYSEAKQIGSVQGRNHRENLVATSTMVGRSCLYKLLSIKYHWLNVPIFCRQHSTLSHGSGKYSEAKQVGSVQGHNHGENLVATSAMVMGRICFHCTGRDRVKVYLKI